MNGKTDIFDSEHALTILKEIETNPQITQRSLAKKLDISLGKTNFLIRALLDKGAIEAENFKNSKNKLAYMYLLTPRGIKTKLELTHKFFAWKLQQYERLEKEIKTYKTELQLANALMVKKT